MLSFIQQIKKNRLHSLQAILPTAAYISNKSDAIGVQHSSTFHPPSAPFYTYALKQTDVVS